MSTVKEKKTASSDNKHTFKFNKPLNKKNEKNKFFHKKICYVNLRTLNLSSPTGGFAYGTPRNDFIDLPPYDRRLRPINLLPLGNVIRSSSDVRATINATKQQQNDRICK